MDSLPEMFNIVEFIKLVFDKGIVRKTYTINDDITMIFELKTDYQNMLKKNENLRLLLNFETGEIFSHIKLCSTSSRFGTYFGTSDKQITRFVIYILNSLIYFLKHIHSTTFLKMDFDQIPFFHVNFVYCNRKMLPTVTSSLF